jgi:hypothetical protein
MGCQRIVAHDEAATSSNAVQALDFVCAAAQ